MLTRYTVAAAAVWSCLSILPLKAEPAVANKAAANGAATTRSTTYKTVAVNGLNIFYREAGPKHGQRSCCFTGFRHRRGCSTR